MEYPSHGEFFYTVTKLICIHLSSNFYASSTQKNIFAYLDHCFDASNRPSRAMIQNFKFMNCKFFQKNIHNGSWIVHKNVRSSTVKIVFESDVSLRNYRKKIEEIKVDARMHACVSLHQLLSSVTSSLWRGFYSVYVSLRNYRKKWKRLEWTHACMHVSACISCCQCNFQLVERFSCINGLILILIHAIIRFYISSR